MSDLKQQFNQVLSSLTQELIDKAGIQGTIEIFDHENDAQNCVVVSLTTDGDVEDLTHRSGMGIKSMEHLLRVMINKRLTRENQLNFVLDVNDFRKTHTKYLIKLAKETAERVRTSKRAEALLPMSSYERRLVHMELAAISDISTESIGEDPKRRIVIKPL